MGEQVAPKPGLAGRYDWGVIGLFVVLALTALMRFSLGRGDPLWLDEGGTAIMATRPSIADFLRTWTHDPLPPLSYIIWSVETHTLGIGSAALRLPALLFGLLTPLAVLIPAGGLSRSARFTWCALLACWIPGIWCSQDARYYTLEVLLSAAQVVAFIRLASGWGRRDAWTWTGLASLAMLTHWGATFVVVAQAVGLLILSRGRVLRHWLSLLAFAPAAAAMALQALELLDYSKVGESWVQILSLGAIENIIDLMVGTFMAWRIVGLWLAVAAGLWLVRRPRPKWLAEPTPAVVAVLCSVAGVAIGVGLGLVRPFAIDRYFFPMAPGFLLGAALAAEAFKPWWKSAGAILVSAFFMLAVLFYYGPPLTQLAMLHQTRSRTMSIVPAAHAAMSAGVKHLVFLQDEKASEPVNAVDDEILHDWAAFPYRQAGYPIDVRVIHVRPDADPNQILIEAASAPHTAILWYYQAVEPDRASRAHPPRISAIDPSWSCRNYDRPPAMIYGCVK